MDIENEGGLWRRHFHWSVLLKWEVLGWIVAALPTVAGLLLVFDQYIGANICFMLTAAFLLAKVVHVAVIANDAAWHRLLFTFVLFGIIGVGVVETIRGVNRWAHKHRTEATETQAQGAKPGVLSQAERESTELRQSPDGTPEPKPFKPGGDVARKLEELARDLRQPIIRHVTASIVIPFVANQFRAEIPFNTNFNAPLNDTYSELSSIASLSLLPKYNQQTNAVENVTLDDEMTAEFISHCLEYYILREIDEMQTSRASVNYAIDANGKRKGMTVNPSDNIAVPDPENYPAKNLDALWSKLGLAFGVNAGSRDWMWYEEHGGSALRVPTGTKISVSSSTDKDTKATVYILHLGRQDYSMDFVIHKTSRSVGTLPPGFELSPSREVLQVLSYTFDVDMKFTWKGDHSVSDPYVAWADGLFAGLHKRLVIPPDANMH